MEGINMNTADTPRRIHPLWPTILLLAGLVLLFVGERILAGSPARLSVSGLGGILIGAAVVGRALGLNADDNRRGPRRRLFWATVITATAAGFYALIPGAFASDEHARIQSVLWGVWPALLVCGAAPLIAIEIAVWPVAFNPAYEARRVDNAFQRGLGLGLLVSVLFYGNFLAERHNTNWDVSYGHTMVPSMETKRAVRDLSKDIKVHLFFPRTNGVADRAEQYLAAAQSISPKLSINRVDQALAPDLARKLGVTENGYVVVTHEKAKEKIRLGTKLRNARSHLRRFDTNFLKGLLKVTTQKRVAYLTMGHEERSAVPHKEDRRSAIRNLKRQLHAWHFEVRDYGLGEGLAHSLPEDENAVLFILGPEKPFLPSEIEALKKGLDNGARIFVALEAEREGDALADFLTPLGLSFDKTLLANERYFAPLTRTKADRHLIFSNRYSSHESVTTVSRNAQKLPTLFSRTGGLRRADDKKLVQAKTNLVLTAMDDTFQDTNGDLSYNPDQDAKNSLGLAAAVTIPGKSKDKKDEARVFVLSDIDVLSDQLLKVAPGNMYLFSDAVYWLQKQAEPVVPTVSEEDVRIVHKKDEDALVFYGTTFGVPALVLLFGLFGVVRRR